MARSFAYNAQKTMPILWIPGDSEASIKQGFEKYASQICGNDRQYSDHMPLIARQLSKRFSAKWLVVFDGLDAALINIQQYLFSNLEKSKILLTTRNKDLASYIKATHVLRLNPLNDQIGQDLLNVYMNTDSAPLIAGQTVQKEHTPEETDARSRIVKELGGLPFAIAIVGAALRKEVASPALTAKAILHGLVRLKTFYLGKIRCSLTTPLFGKLSTSRFRYPTRH